MDSQAFSVVLADDHAIVREGIAALCAAQAGLRVVGQCADGLTAVEMIRSLRPDFAILDLNMPKMSGLEALRQLRQSECSTRLIILSITREEEVVMEALRAGADGYLVKDGPSRHLRDAIRYIHDGGVYISPLIPAARLFSASRTEEIQDPLATLSRRERQIFSYLTSGARSKEIAESLSISPKTVDAHRASLMRKLKIRNQVELIRYAIERSLTPVAN